MKHLGWSFLWKLVNKSTPLTISAKISVLVVWLFLARLICSITTNKSITNAVVETSTRNWLLKSMETWLVLLHAISLNLTIMTIISVLIQLCLTISFGIQNTACLTNLFSGCSCCVETGHLICGFVVLIDWLVFSRWEWLLTGFSKQAIQYHILLAWHFLY